MHSGGEWNPPPITDAVIRDWMKTQGLPVGSTRYYPEDEVYAWRHEVAEVAAGSPTLWIARPVLEENDPASLVAALARLGVSERMRAAPKARFLIVQEDLEICVRPWGHGPDRGQ
ncbi:MAG: hypothetical protein ACTHQQ_05930 [Solirubrobacteraceae bacterium]